MRKRRVVPPAEPPVMSAAEARDVVRRVLTAVDPAPAVGAVELEQRLARDRAFLASLAPGVDAATGAGAPSPAELLTILYRAFPDVRGRVDESLASVRSGSVALVDVGSVEVGISMILLAAAVMRPRVSLRRTRRGRDTDLDLRVEIQGIEDPIALIQTVRGLLTEPSGDDAEPPTDG